MLRSIQTLSKGAANAAALLFAALVAAHLVDYGRLADPPDLRAREPTRISVQTVDQAFDIGIGQVQVGSFLAEHGHALLVARLGAFGGQPDIDDLPGQAGADQACGSSS